MGILIRCGHCELFLLRLPVVPISHSAFVGGGGGDVRVPNARVLNFYDCYAWTGSY